MNPKQRKPRASFVVPAFNAERWISKAIYSCRNQTVKELEILVINDASDDATGEIIDFHAKEDSRVRHLRLTENKGSAHARNLGTDEAKSPVIFVLDADDMAARNRVKDTLVALELKKADLVFGSFFTMDSMGNAMTRVVSTPFDPEQSKKNGFNYICHSTMAYKKDIGIRYDEDKFRKLAMEDWKFQWDAFRAGKKFAWVKSPLCYLRITEGSQSAVRDADESMKVKREYLNTI